MPHKIITTQHNSKKTKKVAKKVGQRETQFFCKHIEALLNQSISKYS
jgi:hypothetical protein